MSNESLYFLKRTFNSINSVASLARALRVEESFLIECINTQESQRYKKSRIPTYKKNGSIRETLNPCTKIRIIQKSIKDNLLQSGKLIIWPTYIYGVAKKEHASSPAKDFVGSAQLHCKQKTILKLDITDFFQNIGEELVFNVFYNLFKYPTHISSILTNLCMYEGHLPQGGLTSSHLASLVLFDEEPQIVKILKYKDLSYSRYIDDITVSSRIHNFDMSIAKLRIINMLNDKGLTNNNKKTSIETHGIDSVKVHGLLVHNKKPQVNADYKRNIRSALNELRKIYKTPNGNTNFGYKKIYESISGRISLIKRLNHPKAIKYRSIIRGLKPKSSPNEVDILKSKINILNVRHEKKDTSWFKYEYKQIEYRISILAQNQIHRKNEVLREFKSIK